MRVFVLLLGGLLTAHAGASWAATATASLPISVTVLSVCAVSLKMFDQVRVPFAAAGGRARVTCSPAAAYTISDSDAARSPTANMRASTFLFQPQGRRDNVRVVEIGY